MANKYPKHLFELCLAALFISTSGPLGKFIDMSPSVIIWWRSALGAIFLYFYCRYIKADMNIKSKKDVFSFLLGGIFLAIHWVTYFYALKLSNVALGMLSLYTFPIISALLEPFFFKTKLNPIHIVLGLVVLLGIYILAPESNFETSYVKGISIGVLSAFFYALRLLVLKKHVYNYNGSMLMFYQLIIVSIVLFPVLFFMDTSNIQTQFPYLLLLALVTTTIGHTMLVHSLKYFSVSTSSIISSTQPIFGIVIAYFFLSETPTWNTFFGGCLILLTVIIEAVRSKHVVPTE